MSMPFLRLALAGLACSLALVGPALAETVTLKAQLAGAKEVPPNNTQGKGEVTATFDTASKMLSWKGDYSGLTGPAIMAHFHGPATPSKNAGVIIPIFMSAPSAKNPFEGSVTLTDQQAEELLAGEWYVNVHTDANKAGEIRGQLTK
jgi:CHRD domain